MGTLGTGSIPGWDCGTARSSQHLSFSFRLAFQFWDLGSVMFTLSLAWRESKKLDTAASMWQARWNACRVTHRALTCGTHPAGNARFSGRRRQNVSCGKWNWGTAALLPPGAVTRGCHPGLSPSRAPSQPRCPGASPAQVEAVPGGQVGVPSCIPGALQALRALGDGAAQVAGGVRRVCGGEAG